jgi:hypothetical protein
MVGSAKRVGWSLAWEVQRKNHMSKLLPTGANYYSRTFNACQKVQTEQTTGANYYSRTFNTSQRKLHSHIHPSHSGNSHRCKPLVPNSNENSTQKVPEVKLCAAQTQGERGASHVNEHENKYTHSASRF